MVLSAVLLVLEIRDIVYYGPRSWTAVGLLVGGAIFSGGATYLFHSLRTISLLDSSEETWGL